MGTCKQQSWITVKLVQPPSSIGDWAVQVRAGESRAEEQGFVLTNTVYKTSMESGLSKRGQNQVRAPLVHKVQSAGCRSQRVTVTTTRQADLLLACGSQRMQSVSIIQSVCISPHGPILCEQAAVQELARCDGLTACLPCHAMHPECSLWLSQTFEMPPPRMFGLALCPHRHQTLICHAILVQPWGLTDHPGSPGPRRLACHAFLAQICALTDT